jgi:hypothetical protein
MPIVINNSDKLGAPKTNPVSQLLLASLNAQQRFRFHHHLLMGLSIQ